MAQNEAVVTEKPRTIDIDEDLRFQQREWLFQRIGIAVLFAFVVSAVLGFTGGGGLMSHGEAGERGGPVHVEYERFVRRGARATMKLNFHNDPPGFIQFWISAPYLSEVAIESIAPLPQTVTVEGSRHVYTIRAASPEVTVAIEMQHQTSGALEGEAGIVGGEAVTFRQLSLF